MKIFNYKGYEAVGEELQELRDLRDKMEERGMSTSTIEAQIDEICEARSEFRNEHKEEFMM
jgi:hypothetical protein